MSFKERLQRFYAVYNPAHQCKVNDILRTYVGNEELMFERIKEKYGADPRDPLRPATSQRSAEGAYRILANEDAETRKILRWLDAGQQDANEGQEELSSTTPGDAASRSSNEIEARSVSGRLDLRERDDGEGESDSGSGSNSTHVDEQRLRDLLASPCSDEEDDDEGEEVKEARVTTCVTKQAEHRPEQPANTPSDDVEDLQPDSQPEADEVDASSGSFNPLLLHFPSAKEAKDSQEHEGSPPPDSRTNAEVVRQLQERASRLGITASSGAADATSETNERVETPSTDRKVWFWRTRFGSIEHYVLRWESEMLLRLGASVLELIESATTSAAQKVAAYSATTTLAALATAVALPVSVLSPKRSSL